MFSRQFFYFTHMIRTAHNNRRPSPRARGYTWEWDKAARIYRNHNPLCVMCKAQGRVTASAVVDHITPHRDDQALFWDVSNWQALCKECHDIKTIREDQQSGSMTHPDWLPMPACPVILVTGPPSAGKSTYCKNNANSADTIIDLDDCFELVCGVHGHYADRKFLRQAIRLRNKQIAQLAHKHRGRAFLIVSAPTHKECEWWIGKLSAQHVRLDPGQSVCTSRVNGRRRQVVYDWYARMMRDDWKPKEKGYSLDIGDDGWPTHPLHPANKK